jgi:hypothetical protein
VHQDNVDNVTFRGCFVKYIRLALFLFSCLLLWLIALTLPRSLSAQTPTVTVPDVTGLNVPQAAAVLNRAGLRFGTEIIAPWTAESGLSQNTVGAQSLTAGAEVPFGTTVELTVLRSPNALLIYDDNDITLVNHTGGPLRLAGLAFNSRDGSTPASFQATRWSQQLEDGRCAQFWSVGRTASKPIAECTGSIIWIWNSNPGDHFWTGSNGATQFNVVQDGIVRAICPVSATGRCEFYLAGSNTAEVTPYIYIAYTTDQWLVYNNSTDRWMSLRGVLFSSAPSVPGSELSLAAVAGDPAAVLGDVLQLAPGQCIYASDNLTTIQLPRSISCDVIATFNVPRSVWNATTYITSATDGRQRSCPPPTTGRLTLCILPR